jgi:hypothetical protein
MFGIDWDGPLPTEFYNGETAEEGQRIEIPNIDAPISADQFYQLEIQVNPYEPSANYGIELFMRTLEFLSHQNL